MKSPHEDLKEVHSLYQAQQLYKRLGRYLSRDTMGGGRQVAQAVTEKAWRREAQEARRLLEDRFGDAVRLTSATPYVASTHIAGEGRQVRSTSSRRKHLTLNKPEPGELQAPFILHVVLDSATYEPLGSYTDLGQALQQAALVRRMRRVIPSGVSYQVAEVALLRERVAAIEDVLRPLQAEKNRLLKEINRLDQRA